MPAVAMMVAVGDILPAADASPRLGSFELDLSQVPDPIEFVDPVTGVRGFDFRGDAYAPDAVPRSDPFSAFGPDFEHPALVPIPRDLEQGDAFYPTRPDDIEHPALVPIPRESEQEAAVGPGQRNETGGSGEAQPEEDWPSGISYEEIEIPSPPDDSKRSTFLGELVLGLVHPLFYDHVLRRPSEFAGYDEDPYLHMHKRME